MEQKSVKGRLKELPGSKSKFWQHSDKQQIELKFRPKCEHYFIRKTGREIECEKCGAGLFINPPWYIKKGRLYNNGELVI